MIGLLEPYSNVIFGIMVFTLSVSIFWLGICLYRRNFVYQGTAGIQFFPSLSVIIPAHNEEKHIGKTLRSIFTSKYPRKNMEVIVINDGSTDGTASVVKKYPAKLITNKKKIGKVASLNKAISKAKGEVVVTMDADSTVRPDALSLLAKHFNDKRVGAVAGVYKSQKESNMLEKMQSLEYLWFALSRKLQEAMDAVLVVPGALGAFRKEALKKIKGFDSDTMIEDFDITVKMHKAGYKVKCEKNAIARVCAPSTLMGLVKQRTRWFRGGFQVYSKHLDVFGGKLGMVSVLWGVEIIAVTLQLFIFTLLGYEIARHFMVYSLPELMQMLHAWVLAVISLKLTIIDKIFFASSSLFVIGVVNSSLSIKLMDEPMKRMRLYPAMLLYSLLMTGIYVKAIFEELIGAKKVWSLQHGEC